MKIKHIKLKNFKNFKEKEITLSDMTFIKGKNGTGKTTLALDSILFALYGYTTKDSLKDLPTKDKAKSCTVEVELEVKGKNYTVIRSYPTHIVIKEEGIALTFATSIEANNYLKKLVGDRVYFQKFRLIDAYTKETNFLEEGQATIKKIIFSISEDMFNNVKAKLQAIKSERERFNKDSAVVFTHYPSEKRLMFIKSKCSELSEQYNKLNNDVRGFQDEYNKAYRDKGNLEGQKSYQKTQRDKLMANKACYVCGAQVSEEKKKQLLDDINAKILDFNNKINKYNVTLEEQKDLIEYYRNLKDRIQVKKESISSWKIKLESRMAQKEFKYTNKDVLIVKKALEELDKLSSYYLTESIKILEPIINSVLEKIGFTVSFTINEKGKFTITLQKEGIEYKYKDLSTGQKLLLQIAFKLALLLERGESGIVIADEGMSSLDKENLYHVLQIFENLPFQLVFIIHNLDEVPDNIRIIDLNG